MTRGTAVLSALLLTVAGAAWAGDAAPADTATLAEAGKTVFRRCVACHMVGAGAKNRVGPELNGLIGRTAGTAPDFGYSDAMLAAGEGGLVWTAETLDGYLADPRAVVPDNRMAFAGLTSEADRQAVIAYLQASGAP